MNLPLRQRAARLALVASYVAAVGALGMLAWLAWPRPPWVPPECHVRQVAIAEKSPDRRSDLEALAVIWQRDLRRPLFDPAPAPTERPAEPSLAIRLLGTAVEADRRYGLFRLSNNHTTVRPVGSDVDGFEVVSIERGRARLRAGGRDYELLVPWYERIRAAEGRDGH
jgi:hypothetical protein